MGSVWNGRIKLSIFGESHGEAIGAVIDGLPAGIEIDLDYISQQMERRAPGRNSMSTKRRESDSYRILSGMFKGKTTGAPLCAAIFNEDKKSADYSLLQTHMRPGHSDYTGYIKYSGFNDYRGGGHFSGRITAPLMFAGALAMQILERYKKIYVGSRIAKIYRLSDESLMPLDIESIKLLRSSAFPVVDRGKGVSMQEAIEAARKEGNSVGGIVETAVIGVEAGLGNPFFESAESRLSHMLFSIPAVKGVEFGAGFSITDMRGSEANDDYCMKDGRVMTDTNNNGGILGGITSGMPIVFRTAIKPTPSVAISQPTVDVSRMEETTLSISGRHDPCIVQRALPVIEGAAAIVLLDMLIERHGEIWN